MKWYYVSAKFFTCAVVVDDDGIILKSAPIVRRFIGQSFENLMRWTQHEAIVKEI